MSQKDRRSDWIIFALRTFAIAGFIVSAWLLFGDSPTSRRTDQRGPAITPARSQVSPGYTTKPIEELRVGDRVYAHNPEVDDAERSTWAEPDWNDWLHLSLVMPKEDGSELKIELLRPESWVLEQVSYIAKERETASDLVSTSTVSDKALAVGEFAGESTRPQPAASALPLTGGTQPSSAAGEITKHNRVEDRQLAPRRSRETTAATVPLSPLRPFYRQVAFTSALLEAAESELVGLTVEMDLPEMGATGTAVVVDVAGCPPVRNGEGQPVTATFSHPPSTAVLNVIFEGESQPLGVTDNHLFWSVDRQQFLPIGKMEIGETVQTFHGNTKRIEAKLPRPGPEVVYNLEVYGEHVYFVGEQGLLAHNTCSYQREFRAFASKSVSDRTIARSEKLLSDGDFAGWKAHANRYGIDDSFSLGMIRRAHQNAVHGNASAIRYAQEGYVVFDKRNGTYLKVGVVNASKGYLKRFDEQADNIVAIAKKNGYDVSRSDLDVVRIKEITARPAARGDIYDWERQFSGFLIDIGNTLPGHKTPRVRFWD